MLLQAIAIITLVDYTIFVSRIWLHETISKVFILVTLSKAIFISFFCSFPFTFTDYQFDSEFYEIFLQIWSSFFCSFLFTFTDYRFDPKFYKIVLWVYPKSYEMLIPEQQNNYMSEILRILFQAIAIITLTDYIIFVTHTRWLREGIDHMRQLAWYLY